MTNTGMERPITEYLMTESQRVGANALTVLTNDLKKGTMVHLNNGWKARLEDNKKGNIRMATVYGMYTEMGSIYAHDIKYAEVDGVMYRIKLSPAQEKAVAVNKRIFGG